MKNNQILTFTSELFVVILIAAIWIPNTIRMKAYWISWVIIGYVLLFSIVSRGWQGFNTFVQQRKRFLTIAVLVPLVYLIIYYSFIMTSPAQAEYDLPRLLLLFLMFAVTIVLSLLFNNSLTAIENVRLRSVMKWSLGILLGVSAWIVYGYHLHYLWTIGL